ncbi:hypothetical protein CH380_21345 [Leptospira adleri]|uniref:Uncharacterized protein n=2 Tax=Leptospira adleri TaxID=2023186 RepID=A0A2M9YI29_9LEPT|nr:hypothetical protein CH380_21345 [Leptospira adleri]PJZ59504.1 hypothetical protein CH376_23370 [Leptospira adleri]
MPIPVGKSKLKLVIFYQATRRFGKLESEFDLPPNHSIRLNFIPKDIEVQRIHFADQAFKDPKDRVPMLVKERIFEIVATVEPNSDPDEDKPCEIPKD